MFNYFPRLYLWWHLVVDLTFFRWVVVWNSYNLSNFDRSPRRNSEMTRNELYGNYLQSRDSCSGKTQFLSVPLITQITKRKAINKINLLAGGAGIELRMRALAGGRVCGPIHMLQRPAAVRLRTTPPRYCFSFKFWVSWYIWSVCILFSFLRSDLHACLVDDRKYSQRLVSTSFSSYLHGCGVSQNSP